MHGKSNNNIITNEFRLLFVFIINHFHALTLDAISREKSVCLYETIVYSVCYTIGFISICVDGICEWCCSCPPC